MFTLSAVVACGDEPRWQALPSLPDKEGFAGMFAGVCDDTLLAAGGSNFPGKKPWEGGTKRWYDEVFALNDPNGAWQRVGKLPSARGYGVSISLPDGILCIGGADSDKHYRDCLLMKIKDGCVSFDEWPSLPAPCANMCGALVGDTIYMAGGIDSPTATSTLHSFWALDLKQRERGWQSRTAWPGRPRMLAVAAACGGRFIIASGTDLHAGADGKPVRTYLSDVWQYSTADGWKPCAALPQATVAAPSPGAGQTDGFTIVGGDDGALVNFEPKTKHPGFSHAIWRYGLPQDKWTKIGEAPAANVTNPAAHWRHHTVIVSGEARPGVRSPEVWMMADP